MIKKPSNISVKRLTLPPTNVKRIIHVVGKPGEDGHTPTTEELLALITPLIPEPKTPDEEAIKADILKKLTKKVEKICEKMKEGKETKEEPEEDENEEKKELEISEDRWDLIIKYDGKTYKIPRNMGNAGSGGGSSSWLSISDKPETFPPSSHTHAIADVTGLQEALNTKGNMQYSGAYANWANQKTGEVTYGAVNVYGNNVGKALIMSTSDTPAEENILQAPLGIYEVVSEPLDLSKFIGKVLTGGTATVAMDGTGLLMTLNATNDWVKFVQSITPTSNWVTTGKTAAHGNFEFDITISSPSSAYSGDVGKGNHVNGFYGLGVGTNGCGVSDWDPVTQTWSTMTGSYIFSFGDRRTEIVGTPSLGSVTTGSSYLRAKYTTISDVTLADGYAQPPGKFLYASKNIMRLSAISIPNTSPTLRRVILHNKSAWFQSLGNYTIAETTNSGIALMAIANRPFFGFAAKWINGIPITIRINSIRSVSTVTTVPINNLL